MAEVFRATPAEPLAGSLRSRKLCTTGEIIQLIALQTISTGRNPMLPRLSGTAASARAKAAGTRRRARRWPRRSASQPPI
ncbi:hypothetical protein K652_23250 [Pseudomonas aeruginosa VRFPA02]|nr:hypothetical protein K652_23250 [Pseudomonas aeruginosa VRFPA02]